MSDSRDGTAFKPAADDRAGIRQVLIQQFMLHEIGHHSLLTEASSQHTRVVPKAHDLMDIYKCLHQGEFGVEHNIGSREGFKQRLFQELRRCGPEKPEKEPLLESVHANARILRVNLRPLLRLMNSDMNPLVAYLSEVCFESAHVTAGKSENFKQKLIIFNELNRNEQLRLGAHIFVFPQPAVEHFFIKLRQLTQQIRQVPVFSHSEIYRRLNRPAYRVVERSVLESSPLKGFFSI